MKMNMTNTKTLLRILMAGMLAAAVISVGLPYLLRIIGAAPAHAHMSDTSSPSAKATWLFHPLSLAEAVEAAEYIVVARVTDIKPGGDLVVPQHSLPGGEDRIPTQRIIVEVLNWYKGSGPAELMLFKTGSNEWYIEGDPPYILGETTVLFLVKRDDGTYRLISPEGRYKIKNGRLAPVAEGEFTDKLWGITLAEFEQELRNQRK